MEVAESQSSVEEGTLGPECPSSGQDTQCCPIASCYSHTSMGAALLSPFPSQVPWTLVVLEWKS